jgi:hypothetical protein
MRVIIVRLELRRRQESCGVLQWPGLPSEFDRDARNGRQRLSTRKKTYYYRGGMQDWFVLGLTTQSSAA